MLKMNFLYLGAASLLLLSGCGHGPWFHGHRYNSNHPRHQAYYDYQCDDSYENGKYNRQNNCWRD